MRVGCLRFSRGCSMAVFHKKMSGKLSERGSALVELMVLLPLLGCMAYGAVNFGVALREKQVIVEAARYGARRAAAESQPVCSQNGESFNQSVPFSTCQSVLGSQYGEHSGDAPDFATFYACQSLESAGFDLTKWRVSSVVDGETQAPTVALKIERAEPTQFFVKSLMGDVWPTARGVFASAKGCANE